jgi:hypothetical protein
MGRVVFSLIISLFITLIISYLSMKQKKHRLDDDDNGNREYIFLNLYTIMNFIMTSLVVYMIIP